MSRHIMRPVMKHILHGGPGLAGAGVLPSEESGGIPLVTEDGIPLATEDGETLRVGES